jgi:glycogen debranching enzyme
MLLIILLKMYKEKFKKTLIEFKNPAELEEEYDEIFDEFEVEFFEEGDDFEAYLNQKKNTETKRDEDNYLELIEKGIDETEAAHIINRIAEKRLKNH